MNILFALLLLAGGFWARDWLRPAPPAVYESAWSDEILLAIDSFQLVTKGDLEVIIGINEASGRFIMMGTDTFYPLEFLDRAGWAIEPLFTDPTREVKA